MKKSRLSLILKMEKILRVKMKTVKLILKVIILRPTNITKKLLPVTNIIIKPVNSDIYEKKLLMRIDPLKEPYAESDFI